MKNKAFEEEYPTKEYLRDIISHGRGKESMLTYACSWDR